MQIHLFRSFVGASGGHIASFESLLREKNKKEKRFNKFKIFSMYHLSFIEKTMY
jgi:hypothetical protein